MVEKYPELKPFFSSEFLKDETVFYVREEDDSFVDAEGVMFLSMNTFRYMVSALNEFFRTYQQGENLKSSFTGFISLLSGEMYGNTQVCN